MTFKTPTQRHDIIMDNTTPQSRFQRSDAEMTNSAIPLEAFGAMMEKIADKVGERLAKRFESKLAVPAATIPTGVIDSSVDIRRRRPVSKSIQVNHFHVSLLHFGGSMV